MLALQSPILTPSTLLELDAYMHDARGRLSPSEIANLAIREWLARPENTPAAALGQGSRGYQWKEMFLPESTDVRMQYLGECFHAKVVGDALIFSGSRVSPRQMTLAVAGDGRNAWRDLSLRFPGNPRWKTACVWRRALRANAHSAPTSPIDAMAGAAASMSAALKAALLLVEHANARSVVQAERRLDRHRRKEDLMIDDCRRD
ncbi:hypothetical protein ACFDR9_001329 [Janthinobacterium sp. CG_23.3]|uniref:hypothetical protein n=1 Tax=Janthinobacterium sp. CG_23.3 TaxID=3349634 RepID=UPI0038D459F1